MMARAAATRCFWPPDIWAGYCESDSVTLSVRAMSLMRVVMLAGRAPLMVSASAMFSMPVSVSSRLESWKMKPSSSRRKALSLFFDMVVMSLPLMSMRPAEGRSMVEMQLSIVVLPEPDGPMMATNSPRATSKLTPASAYTRF